MEPDRAFDLLTMAEVADLLHCSKAHICNIATGRVSGCAPLPAVRMGRRLLVRRESLLSWIERNEGTGDNLKLSPDRSRRSA